MLSGRGGAEGRVIGRSLPLGGSEMENIERSIFSALRGADAGAGDASFAPPTGALEMSSRGVGTDELEPPNVPDGGRGAESGGRRSAGIDGSFGSFGDTRGFEASYSASPPHSSSMDWVGGVLEDARHGRDDVGSELERPALDDALAEAGASLLEAEDEPEPVAVESREPAPSAVPLGVPRVRSALMASRHHMSSFGGKSEPERLLSRAARRRRCRGPARRHASDELPSSNPIGVFRARRASRAGRKCAPRPRGSLRRGGC